jgi:hypothetical protein
LETEPTGDSTGAYDLGYVSPGGYAIYKNVDFGASVSSVSVRTVSGGSGGTLEFHLDSVGGPSIGSATLPVTGGWQTWETVSAGVTGASGVHDLVIIFQGSNAGISNLNWFQFK